jgi:hypothetical protein
VTNIKGSDRVIGVHIGVYRGFVDVCGLTYKDGETAGDCCELQGAKKWGKRKTSKIWKHPSSSNISPLNNKEHPTRCSLETDKLKQ